MQSPRLQSNASLSLSQIAHIFSFNTSLDSVIIHFSFWWPNSKRGDNTVKRQIAKFLYDVHRNREILISLFPLQNYPNYLIRWEESIIHNAQFFFSSSDGINNKLIKLMIDVLNIPFSLKFIFIHPWSTLFINLLEVQPWVFSSLWNYVFETKKLLVSLFISYFPC